MIRTLGQLQKAVDNLVKIQGEDALCASFIFTKEDVQIQDVQDDDIYEIDCDSLEEAYPGIVVDVLEDLGTSSYIYEQIAEIMQDKMNMIRRQKDTHKQH